MINLVLELQPASKVRTARNIAERELTVEKLLVQNLDIKNVYDRKTIEVGSPQLSVLTTNKR